ncbi:MAG: PKD domain-containing protein [Bacteroidota bacterium]|nr:PKD domain-containing protein [Bacteroidota bacterium]
MRKIGFLSTLILLVSAGTKTSAQDFSNKGKDFWVAYGYHQSMVGGGNAQNMVLYFAAEQNTNVTVTIPGLGYTQSYFVAANTVLTSNPLPKAGGQDARLLTESTTPEKKGIHITSDKPIVAYAHIYNASVSGATILFPTLTLGKEYYSVNYTNNSNSANANCWFYVIAADTGITTVEITPSAATLNHPAGVAFSVSLNQGDVYNIMGQYGSTTGVDLTGSVIRSISTASGLCKRIAVFSGSGRINITCNGPSSTASSDNYMSQAFPKSAWGKKYLTVPAAAGNSFNIYRVCVQDPSTVVKINGVVTALPLQGNFYYEIPATNVPQLIEADRPILVAQYFTSQNQCGNATTGQLGDPEVIYLSPVEQNISKVLWNATHNYDIMQHYFNVVIPNTGTAISSFKLDGIPVPPSSFTPHPQAPGYSYLAQSVSVGSHIIQSDSGFNAIAYGYGNAESYGYNAGTNIKDIYQFISVNNQYATVNFPAACKGAPFALSMTFPYQPTQIIWQFNGLFPDVTLNNPVFNSTTVVNGKTLYKYDLAGTYTLPAAGTYPIRIVAQNPTADGCSGVQEIDYDLQIFDPPVADFNFTSNGCLSTPVSFTDNSVTNGRPLIHWYWNFGDGNSVNDVTTTSHPYTTPGSYNVKYTVITDVGCKADTVIHTVVLNDPPVAHFIAAGPYCAGRTVTFTDNSTVASGSITKWHWNFGEGPTIIVLSNASQTYTYAATGTYTVTLQVETASGCLSTVYSSQIVVSPNPVVNFTLPNVCLPAGTAQFNSTSTISDGTENQFIYLWNFGDATPTVGGQNPVHNYTATGPFDVKLTVTSNNGCADSLTRSLTTIYAEPQAAFNAPAEVCLGTAVNFTDQSTAPGSSVTQWLWNFGDATTSNAQNPVKTYAAPGTYTVTLSVTSAIGCPTVTNTHIATHTVVINQLPTANFTISLPGCAGQGVTFTDASAANSGTLVKWTWDYGDATNAILITGTPFVHTYAAVNTYNASLQVETDKGCVSTLFPKSVIINQVPDAGFIAPVVCVNDVLAPFTDTSRITAGSITGWNWNFGDPNANAGNPNTSVLQNPTHHYTQPGNYTAQLVSTSNTGCKDTITHSVIVNGGVLTPRFAVQNTSALCSNKDITIKDASSINAGNILKVEIFWDPADNTIKTTDNAPVAGATYTHTYPEFGSPATKTYTVRYIVYSGLTCSNTYTQDITLLATPQLAFNSVIPVCSNQPAFQLTGVQLQNGLPGSGAFSGAGVSATGLFDPSVAGAGSHDITYTYTANNGCVNSVDQSVIVNPTPVADAGPDKVVLEGGFVVLTPQLITGIPVSYTWTPPAGLNNPTIANAQASPPTDFTYTLTVTSDKGCSTSDDVFIKLLKSPVIPNIFSPNGDGVHDKWVIDYLDSYPGCVVQIYNRYGQMVQRFVNYTTPWDGTINGKDAPVGTYYYIIDPKNGRKPITGFVDIIR